MRGRNQVAPFDQPIEGFHNLFSRELPLQRGSQLPRAFSARSNPIRNRAIEFTVQEKFAVLGIEADDGVRQDISGEVRCKLQNVFVSLPRDAALAIGSHRVSTLVCLMRSPAHHTATGRYPARALALFVLVATTFPPEVFAAS